MGWVGLGWVGTVDISYKRRPVYVCMYVYVYMDKDIIWCKDIIVCCKDVLCQ